MKVALTGITGFVGMSLVPQLRALGSGYQFLTMNIDVAEAEEKYPYSRYPNFRHVHTSDTESLVQFNPDVVLHLATVTTAANNTAIIHPMLAANIEFGVLLLDALQRCDNFKLFVNTGSFAEFRFGPDHFDSAYLYTATKTAFRAFLAYYAGLGKGFTYITAVPYSVYGGQMTVKRLFDYMTESLDATESVEMTAGEQVLDFIHVEDVAGFFVYVVSHMDEFLHSSKNVEDYFLGTGKGTTIREVAGLMEKLSGKKCNIAWGARPYRERDIMYAVAPVERNHSGWKAKIGLEEGIRRMLEK